MPFSGVAMRKDAVEPREAPERRSVTAAGSTEHEQRGRGVPRMAARMIESMPEPAKYFLRIFGGRKNLIAAATRRPRMSQGAASRERA